MRILVSGSTGLVGAALSRGLAARGHAVVPLVRGGARGANGVRWNPIEREIDRAALDAAPGFDAVIHLAGENIAGGRWSAARKQRIHDSRAIGTETLARALAEMKRRPRVLLSASAIGFYGDTGDRSVDEGSAMGTDYLADVCRDWEAATKPAVDAGIRVAQMRTGLVLARDGGALKKMLPLFRLGLGGRLGSGTQWISWIALADLVGAFCFALDHDELRGPVNCVAPAPVTNAEFTRALGRALHRPTVFPAPAPVLRLALGEMADALLLRSARVTPKRLASAGFAFTAPTIDAGLARALGERAA